MSALMLHGILPLPSEPRPAPPHRRVRAEGLAALVSQAGPAFTGGSEPPAADVAEAVGAHHRILAAHASGGAVLPVRFGTLLSSEEAVRQLLLARRAALAAALEGLAGRAEYALALEATETAPAAPTVACGTGRGYLRTRAEALGRTRRVAADRAGLASEVARRTESLAEAAKPLARSEARPLSLALLVRHEALDDLRAAAAELAPRAASAGLSLRLSGPWPSYSFVAGDLLEAAA